MTWLALIALWLCLNLALVPFLCAFIAKGRGE